MATPGCRRVQYSAPPRGGAIDGSLEQLLPEKLRAKPGQLSRFHPNELSDLVRIGSNLRLETAVTQSLSVGGM
ncbi:hypothetical protein [Rhodococcus sp. T7]|uniref:hypothetical protein n=1 Tax=Rhodococcus sp. T7 TaxID=627444 RepID=UPI00135C9463|nr:hypothetical protein [Rhodococcus sp. T7]